MNKIFVLLLLVISATVCLGLANGRNMWPVIVAYWLVLTIKNLTEVWHG